MVEQRICSFCGINIEPGTGRLFVRRDGLVFNFCSSKCYKNQIELKRVPRMTEWTAAYMREKEIIKGATQAEKTATARKVAKRIRKVKEQKEMEKEKSSEKEEIFKEDQKASGKI